VHISENNVCPYTHQVKLEGKDPEERGQEVMKRARCLLRRAIAHTRLGMIDQVALSPTLDQEISFFFSCS
jgi:hypothetical protein